LLKISLLSINQFVAKLQKIQFLTKLFVHFGNKFKNNYDDKK